MTARKRCEACAAWEARYDTLAASFQALALAKSVPVPKAPAVIRPAAPDPETTLVRMAEAEAVIELEAPIFAATNHLPVDVAKQELRKLRGLALETRIDPPSPS